MTQEKGLSNSSSRAVWPDWAIFWNLGNFLRPLATINLPESPKFLGNFCKGVKINHFSCEIIFGQLLWTFGDFYLVTLIQSNIYWQWALIKANRAAGLVQNKKAQLKVGLSHLRLSLIVAIIFQLHLLLCISQN